MTIGLEARMTALSAVVAQAEAAKKCCVQSGVQIAYNPPMSLLTTMLIISLSL